MSTLLFQQFTARACLLFAVVHAGERLSAQFKYNATEFATSPGMGWIVRHGNVILGIDGSGNTNTWNGDAMTWTSTGAASISSWLSSGTAAFATRSSAIGWNGSSLIEWSGTAWNTTATSGGPPTADSSFSMAGLSNGDTILFGGYDNGTSSNVNETWSLSSFNVWSQLSPSTSPSARSWAAIAADSNNNVLIFGGVSGFLVGGTYLSDTWQFNGTTWTQTATTGPSARAIGGLCFRPDTGDFMLIGGTADPSIPVSFSDCWTYSAGTWTQRVGNYSPSYGYMFNAAFDTSKKEVITVDYTVGPVIVGSVSRYQSYGTGCNCGSSPNPFTLTASGTTTPGSTFTLSFTNFDFGNPLWVIFDSSTASSPTQIAGLPAGCVYNIPTVAGSALVNSNPTSSPQTFNVTVPNTTSAIGVRQVYQGLQWNLGTFSGCSSNAQDVRVGRV